jgi:hypothetical protein
MQDKIEILAISGGVWATTSITETPEIELGSWRVFETEKGERHFVGYNLTEHEGRVSSAIQAFDPDTMTGITSSGRVYQLIGNSGFDQDALYTWNRWKKINKVVTDIDVTENL